MIFPKRLPYLRRMKKYDEKICRYSLNKSFGYHPATAHALINEFGSAEALFTMGYKGLTETLGAGYKDLCLINDHQYEIDARELHDLESTGARFLPCNDPNFPSLLKECDDYPIGLHIRSETSDEELFSKKNRCISIIGTRDLTSYGKEWCERIVEAMHSAIEKPTIVSGLAFGVDITAHRKALNVGLPTIAVIPTGIDAIYPASHQRDAARIAKTPHSAVITDYPPHTSAMPLNFLRRNRIIAGLCDSTILIESRVRGGGMMTARLAHSYFRDVYALPGRVVDLRSHGSIFLIKEKIAEAIFSEEELLKSLGLKTLLSPRLKKTVFEAAVHEKFDSTLAPDQVTRMVDILNAIKNSRGIDIEQISRTCSIPYRETLELTSLLQCENLIMVDLMQRCALNR